MGSTRAVSEAEKVSSSKQMHGLSRGGAVILENCSTLQPCDIDAAFKNHIGFEPLDVADRMWHAPQPMPVMDITPEYRKKGSKLEICC